MHSDSPTAGASVIGGPRGSSAGARKMGPPGAAFLRVIVLGPDGDAAAADALCAEGAARTGDAALCEG